MNYDSYFEGARPTPRFRLGNWAAFLTRRRGQFRFDWTDLFTYSYLLIGTLVMLGPVLWLVMSSFKPVSTLYQTPPTFLPRQPVTVTLVREGEERTLPLVEAEIDGQTRQLAQLNRIGLAARLLDPANPDADPIQVNVNDVRPVQRVAFSLENYTGGIASFPFWRYLTNSLVVTTLATLLTLLVNSMAAYGLSKYRFAGRDAIFVVMLATLMVPVSVILVPAFLVLAQVGWTNNLLGVIVPGAATPTGVFLLRQYMLTIPDELIESARIDGASEWRIFWSVILPLSGPALAVLAIFSVMWRWNDFLWPLIVLQRSELYTLQLGLNNFQGELNNQLHFEIAMTVLTLLPITVVFAFLQRFITGGIATTGMK